MERMALVMAVVVGISAGVVATGKEVQDPAATSPATTAEATQNVQNGEIPKDLADFMDRAIALLEAGMMREAIEFMAEPDHVARIREKGEFDTMVERFAKRKAERVLRLIRAARTQSPILTVDGKRASFSMENQGPRVKPLVFKKLDGKWRVENEN